MCDYLPDNPDELKRVMLAAASGSEPVPYKSSSGERLFLAPINAVKPEALDSYRTSDKK